MIENVDPVPGTPEDKGESPAKTIQDNTGGKSSVGTMAVQVPKALERLKQFFVSNATVLAAVITAGMFVVIIGSLFWPYIHFTGTPEKTLLHELSNTEVARGLITFLVAVSTVGIALILTVYAVATQDPKAKENFGLAKEVLSSLIGVLGTIVGFYFGSTMTPPGAQPGSRPTATASQPATIVAPSTAPAAPQTTTGAASTPSK